MDAEHRNLGSFDQHFPTTGETLEDWVAEKLSSWSETGEPGFDADYDWDAMLTTNGRELRNLLAEHGLEEEGCALTWTPGVHDSAREALDAVREVLDEWVPTVITRTEAQSSE